MNLTGKAEVDELEFTDDVLPLLFERLGFFLKLSLVSPLMILSRACLSEECFLSKGLVNILKVGFISFISQSLTRPMAARVELRMSSECCSTSYYTKRMTRAHRGSNHRVNGETMFRRHAAVFCYDF